METSRSVRSRQTQTAASSSFHLLGVPEEQSGQGFRGDKGCMLGMKGYLRRIPAASHLVDFSAKAQGFAGASKFSTWRGDQ